MKHAAIMRPRRPSASEVAGAGSMRAFWLVAFAPAVGLPGPALVRTLRPRTATVVVAALPAVAAVASRPVHAQRVGP